MAQFNISKPYTMPVEDVREVALGLAERLKKDHAIRSKWQGDSVSIKGSGIDGSLDFHDGQIDIHVKLGMMTSMFAPVLKKEMQRYLDENIS